MSVCVHMCVRMFTCACIHVCVCVCVCVCMHTCVSIDICQVVTRRHTYIQTHTYTLTHTGRSEDTNTHNHTYQSSHPPSLLLRRDGVFLEPTRILSGIQFTVQFIEFFVAASSIFLISKTYKRHLSIYLFYMSLVASRLFVHTSF